MTDSYQQTLSDRWNDTYRRLVSLEKRMDAISEKINKLSSRLSEMEADAKRRRSAEF